MYFVFLNNSNQHMYYLLLFSRIFVILPDGLLCLDHPRPAGWTHLTLNYIGSENEQATIMYYDSEKVASTTTKYSGTNPPGDSRIVVGRRHADTDQNYISAKVDELIFFNKTLSSTDIKLLYNGI